MKQPGSGYKHPAEVQGVVAALYRNGHTEGEIVKAMPGMGQPWDKLNRSTVNRWLKAARDTDPDLVIRHHLGRRKWRPGLYNDWQIVGKVILAPFFDPLTDTLHVGSGMGYSPLPGSREPKHIVHHGQEEWEKREKERLEQTPAVPYDESVSTYLVQLRDVFGYSYRDIAKLSRGEPTRFPDKDKLDMVRWAAKQLQPMSYSRVRRIILRFSSEEQPSIEFPSEQLSEHVSYVTKDLSKKSDETAKQEGDHAQGEE